MGPGTFQAKLIPLSKVPGIDKIYVARRGTPIDLFGVTNIELPKILNYRILYILLMPFYLTRYSKKFKIDLILSYHIIPFAFFAYLTYLLTGKPYIVGQTGLFIQRKFDKNNIFRFLLKKVLKNTKSLNVPGNASVEFWKDRLPGINVNILHSTIDTDLLVDKNFKERPYDFVFVGRVVKLKQIDLLIQTIRILKDTGKAYHVAIVGDGNELVNLEQLTNDLDLKNQIHFLGFRKDVSEILHQSKYIVLLSRSEGLPCALMEAMSCGIVPISSKVGNIPDLISHEKNGFLIEDFTLEAIQNELEKAMRQYNTDLDFQMRKSARNKIVESHSYHAAIRIWENKILNYEL
jgi:glycosyltransferase involved in cell wall biosynthesis